MNIRILANLTDYLAVIEEHKKSWLYELLYFIGVDIERLESLPTDKALEHLLSKHIFIYDYPDIGALKVERREDHSLPVETIGEWAGPSFVVKRDEKGELYYEIDIETWSIIDDSIDIS